MVRPSHVRDAIFTIIGRGDRHDWSIDDLVSAVHAEGIESEFSSVFRAVRQLERAGMIQGVDLGDGKARYEVLSEHHEHVLCTRCGAVAGVGGCNLAEMQRAAESMTGFVVTGHRVLFHGLCGSCVSQIVSPS